MAAHLYSDTPVRAPISRLRWQDYCIFWCTRIHVKIFISITQRLLLSPEVSELWNFMLKLRVYCEGNVYDFLVIWREFESGSFSWILSNEYSMMLLRPICNKISQHLDIRICLHLSYQRTQRLSCVQTCCKKMLVDPSSTSVAARQWSRVEASVHCVDWRRSRACIISHRFIALYGTPLGSSHWATLTGTIQKNPGDMMAFQPRKFLHSQKVFVLYFEINHSRDMPKFEYLFRWSG